MKKDRYVALSAVNEGTLLTRPFILSSDRLTVNADATRGEIRIRLLSAEGAPLQDVADAKPILGDVLAAEVHWPKSLAAVRGKSVRLEFQLRKAAPLRL